MLPFIRHSKRYCLMHEALKSKVCCHGTVFDINICSAMRAAAGICKLCSTRNRCSKMRAGAPQTPGV